MEPRPSALLYLVLKRTGVAVIALVLGLMVGSFFAGAIAGDQPQASQSQANSLASAWSPS